MKKLKLNLDELKVESFETDSSLGSKKGTIYGNSDSTAALNGCTVVPCSGQTFCGGWDCTALGVCPTPSADNTLCIVSCLNECYATQPGFGGC